MKTYAEAFCEGMKGKTYDISPATTQDSLKLSRAITLDKFSFLDLPRELRDIVYGFASYSNPEPEIERRFQWADRALIRGLPHLNLILCSYQVGREYLEQLAREPFETSLVIEIGNGNQWWRDRPFDDPWWDSTKYRGLENRLSQIQTLELIFHADELSFLTQPFYKLREALDSAINLSQRRKTRFTYCLDMETLQEHLETFGNILPASMMRDAFYRSEYAVKMGEKGLMSDDDIETRMRARRGAFENETITMVHDKVVRDDLPMGAGLGSASKESCCVQGGVEGAREGVGFGQ